MKTRACIPGRLFVRTALRFAPACLALAPLFCARASALTVRTKADMRLWETMADCSAPLSWSWEEGADSARLVFSNCVTRTVSSVSVQRVAGETRGSCAQPAPQGGEGLFGVTLVQRGGGAEMSRDSASPSPIGLVRVTPSSEPSSPAPN